MTEDEELAALVAATLPRALVAGRWSARLAAKLVPTVSATSTFTIRAPQPLDRIQSALSELKATVRTEAGVDAVGLYGHLGSGHLGLNPTVFVIKVRTTSLDNTVDVSVRAAANEGLIRQHSARGAIDRIRASLSDVIVA
jgi:hypothetical protein